MKNSASLLLFVPLATFAAEPVDFNRDIRPVFNNTCYHCHGQDEESRKAKLRLDLREEATKDADGDGITPIVPGKRDASEVWKRLTTKDEDDVMPPPDSHFEVTKEQIELIGRWINEGANYSKHWAFDPPKNPAVPKLPRGTVAKNPVDNFVAAKLPTRGLKQNPEADRNTLIRRLSLDITGLPPTREEVAAFVSDKSADAYDKAVDRLLASPHYGEKWARIWLDLARYADSSGYGSDILRLNMWPYREWVINALNENMGYDQFSIEQLAGDLLPNATEQQQLATAFHRQTMMNTEGGTDDEEYRVAAVKDRVNTTMQVWMGLTAGCAQCHTHKFDPITHHEYYQLFAIFNQTEDADRQNDAPLLPLASRKDARKDKLTEELAELEAKAKTSSPEFEKELTAWSAKAAEPVAWQPLTFVEGTSKNGSLQEEHDGSLKAVANPAANEKFTAQFKTSLKGVTAFRLETLPGNGKGEASLTGFEINTKRTGAQSVEARYIRIEGTPKQILHLAEVQAFRGSLNVAQKGVASQSTTGYGGDASRAIDGNTSGIYTENSVSHNADGDPKPFWQVDLMVVQALDRIVIWNRADGVERRIVGATLSVLDVASNVLFTAKITEPPQPSAEFAVSGITSLRIASSSSDIETPGNSPSEALDGGKDSGWEIPLDNPHAAVFELAKPFNGNDDTILTFTLSQGGGRATPLTKFRLSATTAPTPVRELPGDVRKILATADAQRTDAQRKRLADYFRPQAKSFAALNKQIADKQSQLAKIKPVSVPVMVEKSANPRTTHVLSKGNYLSPADVVKPAVLHSFHAGPTGNVSRLDLARWLVSPENPLTARVTVNRFWAQLFGLGIVETEEDFGTQGTQPVNPELLDWLAVQFQTPKKNGGLGWDMKALVKLLVTSQTYRQSSVASDTAREKDPRNQLVSHYPRRRLEAEAIRDQALAVAGLLDPRVGGPSVYPPQPGGLWVIAFRGAENYPTSTGGDRWRRGIYTIWRRIAPNPSMVAFDAPSRELCTVRRLPTNTPLQSFVTLNDPVYVEAAQAFARRILREAKGDNREKIRWALETALARPPTKTQIEALAALLEKTSAEFKARPDDAKKLAASSELPLPAGADAAELAAWTTLANVLLNLDALLTKS